MEGLERTLQVELTYVPSGVAKVLRLRTIYREPGHYAADLIPHGPRPLSLPVLREPGGDGDQ